jgi:hypothetical protein
MSRAPFSAIVLSLVALVASIPPASADEGSELLPSTVPFDYDLPEEAKAPQSPLITMPTW